VATAGGVVMYELLRKYRGMANSAGNGMIRNDTEGWGRMKKDEEG
jgi:hypothetical protein